MNHETGAGRPGPEQLPPLSSGEAVSFWDRLEDPSDRPFAVELTPPAVPDLEPFLRCARELRDAGAHLLTVTDSPGAVPRMDACMLACRIRRELNMEVMPHMTCRDRNQIAAQALLLGLSVEEIRHLLIVTGDPVPASAREELKTVYQFSSRQLLAFVSELNRTLFPRPFHLFAALNVNARNFPRQLSLAREKEDAGCSGFLTQPVFTREAAENLRLARQELRGKILGGIMPIVSHRNAVYLNTEVAGIRLDPDLIARYEGLEREQAEELSLQVSLQTAKLLRPYVDGWYLMTPFLRASLMSRLMEILRRDA